MDEGILSIDPMNLNLFRKHFPEMAAVQSITTFQIEENSSILGYTVYFIGPFLFGIANDKSKSFLIYVPHYIIRYAPKTVIIELLPFHKYLKKKLIFHFKKADVKDEIYERLKYSQSCRDMFPPVPLSFDLQVYRLNPETQTLTQNQFNIGESIITLSSFKGKYCIDTDTKISTLFDNDEIDSTTYPFGFVIHSLFPETVYIITKNLDVFLIAFLTIEKLIQHIHTFAIINSMDVNRFSKPFPVKKIQYYWPEQNEMRCKDIKMICPKPISQNEINIKDYVRIPEKASNNLQVVSFDQDKKRTVLLSSSEFRFFKHSHYKQNNEKLLFNNDSLKSQKDLKFLFNEEIQKIIQNLEDDESSVSVSSQLNNTANMNIIQDIINDGQISIKDNYEPKKEVFSIYEKDGRELFLDFIGLPTVDSTITDYCNLIGLIQDPNQEAFPERSFFAQLESKLCSLPQSISINDHNFQYIFHEIVSVMRISINENVLFDFLDNIVDHFPNIDKCIPHKDQNNRLEILILRLIMKKELSAFFQSVTDNRNIMKYIFNEFSPLYSSQFYSGFKHFIGLLSNYSFKGDINSETYFHYRNDESELIEVPNMISSIIWDKTKLLTSYLRNDITSDVEKYFYDFIFSIVEFLNNGFIIKNKEFCNNCWFLFRELSFTTKNECNGLLQTAHEIIESMREKTAHILILDLAKIAKEKKTHKENSPILNYFSTTVVSQCILQISMFDITPFTNYSEAQKYFSLLNSF